MGSLAGRAFSDQRILSTGLQQWKREKKQGLAKQPTDVEIEALAQTWSEHCKHKIFNASIEYEEDGKISQIESLFKTYIVGSTDAIRKKKGKKDFCLSVFKDNAGVIKFNKTIQSCL